MLIAHAKFLVEQHVLALQMVVEVQEMVAEILVLVLHHVLVLHIKEQLLLIVEVSDL